jgi:glycosyltransferase involved in cell wall biosynthesis
VSELSVSVVVPVHGHAPFLGAALQSIAAQSYRPRETIVVLDGSPSDLPALDRPGLRVLSQPHMGVAAARNAGIHAGGSDLIALLDQDDEWRPDKLELQVSLLRRRSQLDFALSRVEVALEPGMPPPSWLDPEWLAEPIAGFAPSTWLVRRRAFEAIGEFDERYEMACDSDWLGRARLGALGGEMIEAPLVRWRIHGQNASHDRATMRREVLRMMRRHAARQQEARRLRIGAVITAFNYESYVSAAIESVLAQTLPPRRIVVVDDGSTDLTAAIASRYEPRVEVVRMEHGGIGAARTRGVAELPEAEAVVFVDADDLLTAHSIERRAQVLAVRDDVDLVFGHAQRFGGLRDGRRQALAAPEPAHIPGAMLVRRSALDRVGPFPTGLRVAAELDWLLRARELGLRHATVPETVYWRRVHGENNSLRNRDALGELPRALKASLDRRRAAAGQQ